MSIELKVPEVGESIAEVEIGAWLKQPGDTVRKDEPVVTLESEKATVELPAPEAGTLTSILKQKGETARVGEVIGVLGKGAASAPARKLEAKMDKTPETRSEPKSEERSAEPRVMPAAEALMAAHGLRPEQVQATGPGGRILKEDVQRVVDLGKATQTSVELAAPSSANPVSQPVAAPDVQTAREEEIVPMSRLRRTVAERLVEAQHTAALLTTFNEIDMTRVMALRKEHGEAFLQRYQVKLGFMSFFVKAVIDALKQFPALNAEIRGTNIVYHNFFDIGIAVGGGKGLVVPILRSAERMSFAEIETAVADYGKRARENKLKIEELQGGTFTISNGGVFGSLLSTPIVNPPQSGVLGLHAIQERPVAHQGAVVIRPMMYVALTYDHRLVDGREAVTFLRRIKEVIENPARMLMEV